MVIGSKDQSPKSRSNFVTQNPDILSLYQALVAVKRYIVSFFSEKVNKNMEKN